MMTRACSLVLSCPLVGDFIPHVFEEFPALRGTILVNRTFIVSMVAVFFLLPLSLLRGAFMYLFFLFRLMCTRILSSLYWTAKKSVRHRNVTVSNFENAQFQNTASKFCCYPLVCHLKIVCQCAILGTSAYGCHILYTSCSAHPNED